RGCLSQSSHERASDLAPLRKRQLERAARLGHFRTLWQAARAFWRGGRATDSPARRLGPASVVAVPTRPGAAVALCLVHASLSRFPQGQRRISGARSEALLDLCARVRLVG